MISKITFLLAVAVACQATSTGLVSTGVSTTTRRQDSNGNYDFSYDIIDAQGASNFRRETGDANGNKQGSYGLKDTDGRSRTVDYIADNQGYRAVVKTNEQGTAFSAPAGAVIDSPYDLPKPPEPVAVSPPAAIVAPAPGLVTISHPPPVAHPAPIGVAFPPPAPIVAPAPVVVAPAPVARPPPVAHPAPIGVAFSPTMPAIPASESHGSRVDIIHTVPVAPVQVVRVSPFTNVYPVPSPFIMNPIINQFGYGHSLFGGKRFIMG